MFGPRGTGKTTLLQTFLSRKKVLWFDLLQEEVLSIVRDPGSFASRIEGARPKPEWVVVDEIQKLPFLLDEVHRLIESKKFHPRLKFALTGSSARKLKRGAANLLAGRALLNYLHPLTHRELGDDFTDLLSRYLSSQNNGLNVQFQV